jgi:hypothetical protein
VFWISVIVAGLLLITVIAVWVYQDGSRRFDRTMEESPELPAPGSNAGPQPAPCRHRRGA